MAYNRKVPPLKCNVIVQYGQESACLEILPTTLIASVKDLAISQLSLGPQHGHLMSLSLLDGKILSVEFIRLQSADASIAESIKDKKTIELKLVSVKAGLTREERKSKIIPSASATVLAAPVPSSSAPSKISTPLAASTMFPPGRPRVASKIGKLTAVFSSSTLSPSSIQKLTHHSCGAKSDAGGAASSGTGPKKSGIAVVSQVPIIERPVPIQSSSKSSAAQNNASNLSSEEEEVVEVETINLSSVIISSLRDDTQSGSDGSQISPNGEMALENANQEQDKLVDFSRRSISLEGEDGATSSLLATQSGLHLSDMPPPPTLSRYSVVNWHPTPTLPIRPPLPSISLPASHTPSNNEAKSPNNPIRTYGSNRLSNMPVQLNSPADSAELARIDAMLSFFNEKYRPNGVGTNGTQQADKNVQPSNVGPRLAGAVSPRSDPLSPSKSSNGVGEENGMGGSGSPRSTDAKKVIETVEAIAPIQIDAPSLIASTYSQQASHLERKRLVIEKRMYPQRMATKAAAIGDPKSESVLCFRKMAESMGKYVQESGSRILDFVSSPMAVGPFMRRQRIFPVVLLPAGPQLTKSDLDRSRWSTMCDVNTTPSTLMQALFFMSPLAAQNYILRICGTVEYLVDNDRPLVDYSRLRLMIRDRRRIELLCEDRTGARCTEALDQLDKALSAPYVPSPILDPFFGLELVEREMAEVSFLDGQLTLKIHALEHLDFSVLKNYLDLNDSSFTSLKAQFDSAGYLSPSADSSMSFAIEFALIYNNSIVDVEGAIQRTSWRPAPMWVEQIKFPLQWSQLPRELRILMRVLFRKSKTARPFIIGESCINLFDGFGILNTGKQAVPIHTLSTSPISSAPSNLAGGSALGGAVMAGVIGAAFADPSNSSAGYGSSSAANTGNSASSTSSSNASLSGGNTFHQFRNMKHSYSSTSPITSVYKSKTVPFLHYEVYEMKSGLLMMHEGSPVKIHSLRRLQAVSPIEFLIPEKTEEAELYRLSRIHPLYRMSDKEKGVVWKYRYYIHFSSRHSLPLLVKSVNWTNQKMVEELHRLIAQWEEMDPLLALELLDTGISDTETRCYAVECLKSFSDEELANYMLQLIQALVHFETYHDNALARLLLERALRNRTQIGNAFYWHLTSLNTHGDPNLQERVALYLDAYLFACGPEHAQRLAGQQLVLQHFRSLSAKASKLDPKAKMALLEAELNPDLLALSEPSISQNDGSDTFSSAAFTSSQEGTSPTQGATIQATSPRGVPNTATGALVGTGSNTNSTTTSLSSSGSSVASTPASPIPKSTKGRTWTFSSKPSSQVTHQISSPPGSPGASNISFGGSREPLGEHFVSQSFSFLNLPLDPTICSRRILKAKCKFMVSSAAPMWLVLDNADPLAAPAPHIFKSGDDLRQDILILQMLRLMDEIWQRDGLELHVSAYGCVATGKGEGFIEVVQDSTTTGKIQKQFGGTVTGAFKKTPLSLWMQQQHAGNPELLEEAIDNFVSSCAAYCIASYVLGLGDRHADNIMVTTMGNLFHIDFAHILGNIMKFGAYKRERAPFVLTPEFVFVMGDTKSSRYAHFVDLCLKGYNSLRRHTYLFIRLFLMMLSAGLPQFTDERELSYLYKSLSMGLSEQGAADKFTKLIDESRKTTTTLVNNFFHNLATGGLPSGSSSSNNPSGSSSSSSGSSSKQNPSRLTSTKSSAGLTSKSSPSTSRKGAPVK
jgi:hypothetical protein